MIQLSPSMRIFVCVQSVDFRKGIDGLAAVCRNQLGQNPLDGVLFVFRNRGRSSIRLLIYDGQGFWMCTKRLSKGTFKWWPGSLDPSHIDMRQLQTLLWNGNPSMAGFSKDWRKI
jgi:transposase